MLTWISWNSQLALRYKSGLDVQEEAEKEAEHQRRCHQLEKLLVHHSDWYLVVRSYSNCQQADHQSEESWKYSEMMQPFIDHVEAASSQYILSLLFIKSH